MFSVLHYIIFSKFLWQKKRYISFSSFQHIFITKISTGFLFKFSKTVPPSLCGRGGKHYHSPFQVLNFYKYKGHKLSLIKTYLCTIETVETPKASTKVKHYCAESNISIYIIMSLYINCQKTC